ncbi:MAG TPA: hypothetical protein VLF94_08970 [Chlamydiales bacterium]|nr:hypothetical protein [Chlamydiales bacterium]
MIKIAERLRPFSHTPGAACIIPGTCLEIEAFPTLLKVANTEIKLKLTGPVKDFTLEQDLEKDCVRVYGKAKEGFFRLKIEATDAGLDIAVEKGPLKSHHIPLETQYVHKHPCERLSLGNHKAQDWDLVQKRCDLKEFLPVLFALGQKIPLIPPQKPSGTARLLELPSDRSDLEWALEALFKAAFTKILIPRLIDDQHHGLVSDEPVQGNRFYLVQEGAKLVRSLFFRQNERRIAFLPNLPISLDCGRMVGLQAPGIGEIDFEWSKKVLRQVAIRASTPGEVILELQSEIKSLRVRKSMKDKGRRLKSTDPVLLEPGQTVLLDRFQK